MAFGPEDEFDLEDIGASEETPDGGHTALPPKLEAWRRRSAAGAILTGFAMGLQEALEKRKEEPSIVMETSGEPPKDLPVEAEFEYGRPRQSVVQIRPWLLPDAGPEAGATPGSSTPKAGTGPNGDHTDHGDHTDIETDTDTDTDPGSDRKR